MAVTANVTLPRFLRIPLAGLAFLVFYSGASVIAWILLPILRLRIRGLAPSEQREIIDRFMMRNYQFAIRFMAAFGLMRYRMPEIDLDKLPSPPWVVVANHPTLIDVLFIKAALPGVV